jgi:hypothetical protein
MAVSCDINATPLAPNHGDTVTVVYTVTGNDPIDPTSGSITGTVTVGGVEYVAATTITLPGTPSASVSYGTPVDETGTLAFTSTADPATFTAVVP